MRRVDRDRDVLRGHAIAYGVRRVGLVGPVVLAGLAGRVGRVKPVPRRSIGVGCGLLDGSVRRSGPHVPNLVCELVYEDAVPEGGLADVGAATAVYGKAVAAIAYDLDGALCVPGLLGEQGGQTGGVRTADGDAGAEPGACEVRGVLVGDDSALFEGHDPVGAARGLLGVGGGEQHRATPGRVRAQHAVQPAGLAGGESVGRVVEDEGVRVGQQRAGQAETAVHAS